MVNDNTDRFLLAHGAGNTLIPNPNLPESLTGYTRLVSAITQGDVNDVDRLTNAGASLSQQNKQGLTCLHEAVLHHADPTILDILLSAGADPDVQDITGATPLLLAVRRNDLRSVEFLLTYAADINIQDGEGWTPVLASIANNFHALLRLLLAREAGFTRYTRGRSIFDVAAVYADLETNEILAETGLKVSKMK